ncbi:hypothetical protein AMECASPLE_012827 [Ameca splendens]|uniref:Uncharacterized protein n=1 Tax=Ameca splendens TaxID=208324 RepID=A0ABV0Y1E4_9TELE
MSLTSTLLFQCCDRQKYYSALALLGSPSPCSYAGTDSRKPSLCTCVLLNACCLTHEIPIMGVYLEAIFSFKYRKLIFLALNKQHFCLLEKSALLYPSSF